MLKLCSNGVQFRTHLSLHLNRLFLYSTSSATENSPSSMVDFMVKSLGFSREEAAISWSKVSKSNRIKSTQNPYLVVDCLKQRGFSNTQMKRLILSLPILLKCSVDRTLIPKFKALEELGISGSDLADIVSSNSTILRRDFTNRIIAMISYVKSIVGDDKKFFKLLKRSYWLMSVDISAGLQPNIELFRKYGFSNERILFLLVQYTEIFGHDPKRVEEIVKRVHEEFGIPPKLIQFSDAVVLLASLSEKTLETKYGIFRSFGWTDSDIKVMMRKTPRCLVLSEKTFVLEERKLVTVKVGMLTAVCSFYLLELYCFFDAFHGDTVGKGLRNSKLRVCVLLTAGIMFLTMWRFYTVAVLKVKWGK
uniref:Uncharacterized protein n=1 Tax=Chenopodium quinoa TaxID=63459 RepID=A0A803M209_CHEQI